MGHILQHIINFFRQSAPLSADTNFENQIKYTDYSHLYNTANSFIDEFYSNLIRTIIWTEKIIQSIEDKSNINFSTVLRSTNPDYEGKPFYDYADTFFGFPSTPEISFNYLTVLNEALKAREEKEITVEDINQIGKIIEFEIDITTHDGAPCAESHGFIDESDIPPIDTWFYLTKKHLYCWIPNLFIEKMQDAMDVEILNSYHWIKDSKPYLQLQVVERLKAGNNRQDV